MYSLIREWAVARNLIKGATAKDQMLKLTEEVGELASAIARNQNVKIVDSLGDCVIVLTILAAQLGVDLEDCIRISYEEIKNRKGKMVDGIFIKEGE